MYNGFRILFICSFISLIVSKEERCKTATTQGHSAGNRKCFPAPLPDISERGHCEFLQENHTKIPQICKNNTKKIILDRCCLQAVDGDSLERYKRIETLKFPHNFVTVLPNKVFRKNVRLKEIDAADNDIKVLQIQAFYGLSYLLVLNLSDNKLTSLESVIFRHLKKLEVLRLDRNCFLTVQKLFEPISQQLVLPSLKSISLSKNSITKWIRVKTNISDLNLSENNLTSWTISDSASIPGIRRLDLSGNRVTNLERGSFHTNINLVHLDLSHNQLRFLPEDFVENLCNLISLHINGNFLEVAFPEWFAAVVDNFLPPGKTFVDINVRNNPWRCDCKMRRLQNFLHVTHNKMQQQYATHDWNKNMAVVCKDQRDSKAQLLTNMDLSSCDQDERTSFLKGKCRDPLKSLALIGEEFRSQLLYLLVTCIVAFVIFVFSFCCCCCRRVQTMKPIKDPPAGIEDVVQVKNRQPVQNLDGYMNVFNA